MDPTIPDLRRCFHRCLALVILLALLIISRDVPTGSASGVELLRIKVGWTIAWAGLQSHSPLTPLAARLIVRMDRELETDLARNAAMTLADGGSPFERLRWSAALTRLDRHHFPLIYRAVRAALGGRDCRLLKASVVASRSLPRADRARVARLFGRQRYVHWGPARLRAGLRVSELPELRRALRRAQRAPTTRHSAAPCAM
jgi:hypothetical protein